MQYGAVRCGAMRVAYCDDDGDYVAATDDVIIQCTQPPEDNSMHKQTHVLTEAINKYYTRITGIIQGAEISIIRIIRVMKLMYVDKDYLVSDHL